jgi:hypothetical protein
MVLYEELKQKGAANTGSSFASACEYSPKSNFFLAIQEAIQYLYY